VKGEYTYLKSVKVKVLSATSPTRSTKSLGIPDTAKNGQRVESVDDRDAHDTSILIPIAREYPSQVHS
jgi:hypothetical protein